MKCCNQLSGTTDHNSVQLYQLSDVPNILSDAHLLSTARRLRVILPALPRSTTLLLSTTHNEVGVLMPSKALEMHKL